MRLFVYKNPKEVLFSTSILAGGPLDVGKVMVETFKAWWTLPKTLQKIQICTSHRGIERVFSDWIAHISQIPLSDTQLHVTHVATVQVFAQGSRNVGVKFWCLHDHFFCYTSMGIRAQEVFAIQSVDKVGQWQRPDAGYEHRHRTCWKSLETNLTNFK